MTAKAKDHWSNDFGIDDPTIVWPDAAELQLRISYVEGVALGEKLRLIVDVFPSDDKRRLHAFCHEMRNGYNDFIDGRVRDDSITKGYTAGTRIAHHSRLFPAEEVAYFLHGFHVKFKHGQQVPAALTLRAQLPQDLVGWRFKRHRRRHPRRVHHHGLHRRVY